METHVLKDPEIMAAELLRYSDGNHRLATSKFDYIVKQGGIANYPKEWRRTVADLLVAPKSEIDRQIKIIQADIDADNVDALTLNAVDRVQEMVQRLVK